MQQSHSQTKKYLGKIRSLEKSINYELLESQRLRALATNISTTISGDKVQTSPSNRLENIMLKIMAQDEKVASTIEQLMTVKDQLTAEIELIEDDECVEILKLYFVSGIKYEDLPEASCMSKTKVLYVYNRGLELFEKTNGEKYLKH